MALMSMIALVMVSILVLVFLGETLVWVQIISAAMSILSSMVIY